jgi:hypothetical protein
MARVYSTQLLTALSVTGSTETQTVPVGFTQVIRQTIVTLGVE